MNLERIDSLCPVKVLKSLPEGNLSKGGLGVLMARAGEGKTACLAQIGMNELFHDKNVIHIAIGQTIEHVHALYDSLFDEIAKMIKIEDKEVVKHSLKQRRLIKVYSDKKMSADRLERDLNLFKDHVDFDPDTILLDDFDWWSDSSEKLLSSVKNFKKIANDHKARLWITAKTESKESGENPEEVTPPCDSCRQIIDVAFFLEPHDKYVALKLLQGDDSLMSLENSSLKLQRQSLYVIG